jgi:hypothetical protein
MRATAAVQVNGTLKSWKGPSLKDTEFASALNLFRFSRGQDYDKDDSSTPFIHLGCSSTLPQPKATQDRGSSATVTGNPV